MMSVVAKKCLTVALFSLITVTSFANTVQPKIYELDDAIINVTREQPVFMIKLVSNPTTGYAWSLHDYDKSILTLVKHEYIVPKTKLIGASGFDQWAFKVKPQAFSSSQRTTLKLTYERPWDKSDHATEVSFTVIT